MSLRLGACSRRSASWEVGAFQVNVREHAAADNAALTLAPGEGTGLSAAVPLETPR
ncbi:hypothetical protein AB5J49_46240 [Streptomyces sp. R28]|uniref:Uncharacterized protein n=1 Tax=Streptomyces sp. R28 TaxID=3238628 RepID=A0AB39QA42_9ACTN